MPIYSFRCPVCNWTGDRIAKVEDRDNQVCHRAIQVAGLSPVFTADVDGKPTEVTEVSIVPLGKQPDKHATLQGECLGVLVREEIALNAKMRHQWMP